MPSLTEYELMEVEINGNQSDPKLVESIPRHAPETGRQRQRAAGETLSVEEEEKE